MNYQRIYDQLIERAVQRCNMDGYTEKHHIIPKCMGGNNDPENLVRLTAREHFIAHWLLWRIHPTNHKLIRAFNGMCIRDRNNKRYYSSRGFAIAKNAANALEIIPWNKGKRTGPHSAERIAKRSDTRRGKPYKQSAQHAIRSAAMKVSAWQHIDEIKTLKAIGLTFKEIGQKYNCSYYTIFKIYHSTA
jgi:hypothetical protein